MSLLGLDVGTRRCRGLVIDESGQILARAHRDYLLGNGEPPVGGQVRAIWTATQDVVRNVALATRQDPINALSITGSAEAWVPLATDLGVIGGRLLATVPETHPRLNQALEQVGLAQWFEITGHVPRQRSLLNSLLWWRQQNPLLWHDTWRLVPLTSLISTLLGGSTACDPTLASSAALLDTETGTWSDPLLRAMQIPSLKLPEVCPAGQPVGLVHAKLAHGLGLPRHVQIIMGGHDLVCGALGAGATRSGTSLLHIGARLVLAPVFGALPLRSLMLKHSLSIEPHLVPNLFLSTIEHPSGGRLLTWFCEQIIAQEARAAQKRGYSIYERLLAEMPEAPSPLLALPDQSWPSQLIGAEGRQGVLVGFGTEATRGEIIKAMLEGGAYAVAKAQRELESAGIRLERYRVTGSGARSEPWMQMMANVLGRPLERLAVTETRTLGAALLARGVSGPGTPTAMRHVPWTKVQYTFEPDDNQHAIYRKRVKAYLDLAGPQG